MKKRFFNKRQRARIKGYRSGLEDDLAVFLSDIKVEAEYEKEKIKYVVPASNHSYTPDFKVNGIYLETKGRFVSADKKKHLLIKAQHPNLDIRFIFSNPNATSSKREKTTYGEWCLKHGFKYCSIKDVETIYRWVNEKDRSTESPEQTQEQST